MPPSCCPGCAFAPPTQKRLLNLHLPQVSQRIRPSLRKIFSSFSILYPAGLKAERWKRQAAHCIPAQPHPVFSAFAGLSFKNVTVAKKREICYSLVHRALRRRAYTGFERTGGVLVDKSAVFHFENSNAGRLLAALERPRDHRQRQPIPEGVAAAGIHDLLPKPSCFAKRAV